MPSQSSSSSSSSSSDNDITKQRIYIHGLAVDLTINLKTCTATITVIYCGKSFSWYVTNRNGILDVTPELDSFSCLSNFRSYLHADCIFENILSMDDAQMSEQSSPTSYDLSTLAEHLIIDFLQQQENNLDEYLSSRANAKICFNIQILKGMPEAGVFIMLLHEKDEDNHQDIEKVVCDVPLLVDTPYLMAALPPHTSIILRLDMQAHHITEMDLQYMVLIPSTPMPCTKKLDFRFKTSDIVSLKDSISRKIKSRWLDRKLFIEEMQRLATVLEYDAIDFSHVVVTLRVKQDNLYTICNVEFRISEMFPKTLPLISIHDLQTQYSTILASSKISAATSSSSSSSSSSNSRSKSKESLLTGANPCVSVERLARELLLSVASEVTIFLIKIATPVVKRYIINHHDHFHHPLHYLYHCSTGGITGFRIRFLR